MSRGARRLAFGALLLVVAAAAILFAAVAGAATTPAPDPVPPDSSSTRIPDEPTDDAPPPRRHVAMGSIVAMREDRMAVMVPSRDKPILVAIRPMTSVRLNMKKAELSELQRGDQVVVVGRPGPRGNMVARAIVAVRKAAPTQTILPL